MESGRHGPLCLAGLVHLVGYSRGGTCSIPFAFAAEPSPPRGGTSLSSSSSDDGHWVVLTVDWGTEAHNLQVESYILFRDLAETQAGGRRRNRRSDAKTFTLTVQSQGWH